MFHSVLKSQLKVLFTYCKKSLLLHRTVDPNFLDVSYSDGDGQVDYNEFVTMMTSNNQSVR